MLQAWSSLFIHEIPSQRVYPLQIIYPRCRPSISPKYQSPPPLRGKLNKVKNHQFSTKTAYFHQDKKILLVQQNCNKATSNETSKCVCRNGVVICIFGGFLGLKILPKHVSPNCVPLGPGPTMHPGYIIWGFSHLTATPNPHPTLLYVPVGGRGSIPLCCGLQGQPPSRATTLS